MPDCLSLLYVGLFLKLYKKERKREKRKLFLALLLFCFGFVSLISRRQVWFLLLDPIKFFFLSSFSHFYFENIFSRRILEQKRWASSEEQFWNRLLTFHAVSSLRFGFFNRIHRRNLIFALGKEMLHVIEIPNESKLVKKLIKRKIAQKRTEFWCLVFSSSLGFSFFGIWLWMEAAAAFP